MPHNPHANFTPSLEGYTGQGAFRFWCQMALPLTYDDSLSYYELLNKVVGYLNNTISDVANVETNVGRLADAYDQLQSYVNDYFDNIDIEAELKNVLDTMALDGTLDELLSPIVQQQLPDVVGDQISAVVENQIGGAVENQIGGVVAEQLPPLVEDGIPSEVTDWLNENVTPVGGAVIVDNSLTIANAAADAKATGDELNDLKRSFDSMVGSYEFIQFADMPSYHGISIVKSGDSYVTSGLSDQAINLTLGSFTLKAGKTYIFDSGISDPTVTAYYLFLLNVNGTSTWYRTGETFACTVDSTVYIKIYCDNNTTLGASFCPVVAEYPILSTKNLQSKINTTNDELSEIENVLPKVMVLETVVDANSSGWENGYFYSAGAQNILTKSAYAALSCKSYGPVTAGEKFTITARSAGSGYAIILCNSSNIVIDTLVSESSYYNDVPYTVPYDGLMYLNTISADFLSGTKKYNLSKYVPQYKDLSSILKGIKWYTIGDSISEFNNTAETNWIKYMISSTEIDNVNVAKSGAGFYRGSPLDGQIQINYIKQLESIESDAELITIAGSFNDLMSTPWTALPVGTASDTGTSSIAGYMNAFFDALLTSFPTVPIGVYMTSPWDIYKPGVTEADAYVNVLKTICENRGIPFYADCYYGCNLKPWLNANKTEYFTRTGGYVDGVHPNSKGHVFLYRMIKPFLEKIANTTK